MIRNSLRALAIFALTCSSGFLVLILYVGWGLFGWVGYDFGLYRSQSAILLDGLPAKMYDAGLIGQYQQLLTAYTNHPDKPLLPGTVPYLPLYAWLLAPLATVTPVLGFALWTTVNFLAGLYLCWRTASLFPRPERTWVAYVLLASFPMVYSLVLGQPTILLACAVGEFYLALRDGREFRAGLWFSCLVLKPQLAMIAGPLLLWKRRWAAVIGAAVGVGAALAASVVTVGLPALLSYPESVLQEASGGLGATGTNVRVPYMVNWRSLVLSVVPRVDDATGLLVTLALSLLTVACLALVWRGPWRPTDRCFPSKVTLLLLATILVSYHVYGHGVVILAVPLAATFASGRHSAFTGAMVCAGLVLPAAVFLVAAFPTLLPTWLSFDPVSLASRLITLSMVGCFAGLLAETCFARALRSRGSQMQTLPSRAGRYSPRVD